MLNGFDTSHWNGLVAIGGKDFWFGKTTQGTTFVDPGFEAQRQWLIANSPETTRFPYHYAGYGVPEDEANYFLSHDNPDGSHFSLMPGEGTMLDIESPTIVGQALVDWCVAFAQRVVQVVGKAPLAYMDISLQNAYDWSPLFAICGNYLAAPDVAPTANAPVKYEYVFQQTGTINGVDQDVFFGNKTELQDYATPLPSPAPSVPVSEPTPPVSTPPVQPSEPVTPEPVQSPPVEPTPPVTVSSVATPTLKANSLDVLVRSIKTYIAAIVAIASAGGINISHLTAGANAKVAGLTAGFTAILNIVIKVYQSLSI
jgi:hypothetical protein